MPLPLLTHVEPLGQIVFAEGSRKSLEINRPGVLAELLIRFRFTITNGGSAAVGPLWGTLAAYIKRVELTINGRDTPISIDGPGLLARAIYEQGTPPKGSDATVVLTASAATAYDVTIPVPLYLPWSANPFYCALPVDRFGQTTLFLTFGTIADFYATPNSAAISAVTIDVFGRYLVNVAPTQVFRARVLDTKEESITATTTNFQSVVDVGTGLLYRSVLFAALEALVASNDIVNKLSLDTGQYNFQNWDAPVLQAQNINTFQRATAQTGVYFMDMEMMGQPMWIDTQRAVMPANLLATLDVTAGAASIVRLYRESVRDFKV